MTQKLRGTGALVTGASSGIGAATAIRFADDGASVALVARRKDRLQDLAAEIQKAGGTALVIDADITDRTQAEAAVAHTVERFGRLDILVNNAGLMLLGPVVGADPQGWDRMIAINAQGLLYTTHAALPHLHRRALDHAHRPGLTASVARAQYHPDEPWPPTENKKKTVEDTRLRSSGQKVSRIA